MRAFRVFFCIKEALTNEVWAINARYYSSFSVSNGATTIGIPNNFPVIKPIIKDDSLRTGIVNRSLSSETSKIVRMSSIFSSQVKWDSKAI